jgi:putative lipoprotein
MRHPLRFLSAAAALALAGCGHLELSPEGDPSRVLTGQVELGSSVSLPPDAVITVRVEDVSVSGMPPDVLGSQTIHAPVSAPIAFRIEYRAEDEVLLRGLNIEARVSFGGKVRYYNLNRYVVTLGNASAPHRVYVNPVGP